MAEQDAILITIPGPPVCWKSHAGSGRKSWNPLWREKEYYREMIERQYSGKLFDTQIAAEFTFFIPIPISTSKKKRLKMLSGELRPIKRGDRDNMAKFLSDCLQGIVIVDDSIIVDGPVRKFYRDEPGTKIRIWEV